MNGSKPPIFWLVAIVVIFAIGAIVIWALTRDTEGVIDPWEDVDAVVIDEPTE